MRDIYKKYNYLPIYTGHVIREIRDTPSDQLEYYQSVSDIDPILFEKDEIPTGLFNPKFTGPIQAETWKELFLGGKSFTDLKFPKNHTTVYLAKRYYNKKLYFVVSFEGYGGKVSYQDSKNFSLYDLDGVLRRNIYQAGNQDIYERDYFYDTKGQVNKIVEKIVQDGQLTSALVFKRKPVPAKKPQ